MREPQLLGSWLEAARARSDAWKKALFVVLGAIVVLNLFITPHHPHFVGEGLPGFWAVFSLGAAIAMVYVLKKIVYPVLARPEDDNGRP